MGIKQKEENTNGGLHNTLATGTTVKGNIQTETDFRLDGKVEGDVSCSGKIVIGPKGNVTGNIVSANAEILGEVEGSVHVSAKLVLKAPSSKAIYSPKPSRSNRTPASTASARCQANLPECLISSAILLFRLSASISFSNVMCILYRQ